jgi:predicted nucleic acid-binding protein
MASCPKGGKMPPTDGEWTLFDAGLFIGALLAGDSRHKEARPLIESARRGETLACTTPGILSEVYAALTWQQARPPHAPEQAAQAVALLIEPPSAIRLLEENNDVALLALKLAAVYRLRARRVHDARHAAAAITSNVSLVFTYDPDDWLAFENEGLRIAGPASTLIRLGRQ